MPKLGKIILLTFTILFTFSCSMAPRYERPSLPIPSEWPREKGSKEIETAFDSSVKLSWKEFYTDPELKQVIALTLENSRDLKLASLNVERARGLYGIQRANLLPSINVSATASKQRIPANVLGFPQSLTIERYQVDLGTTAWEIDFFGRLRNLKDRALEEFFATEEARKSAKIALIAEVARTYMTLAADRDSLKLAEEVLSNQKKTYELVLSQYRVGMASQLDLDRAKTQVDTTKRDVARYRRIVDLDKNALNLLVGKTVPEDLLPKGLSDIKSPEKVFVGLPSDVLTNRPDILAAEHRLKAAYASIGAARAAFFPRISLTTFLGTASDELTGLFGSGSSFWSVAPNVLLPIFDPRIKAAYRVSKTEQKIALAQYEKAIQTAFKEVADALSIRENTIKELEAQRSLVESASNTYSLALERYKEGLDSYLSVLDAQRFLFAAKMGLTQIRLLRLTSDINLYAALGGGGDEDCWEGSCEVDCKECERSQRK